MITSRNVVRKDFLDGLLKSYREPLNFLQPWQVKMDGAMIFCTLRALDEFCQKMKYNPLDMEFDIIYVNGDNNLENLKRDEDAWKVRMIDEEFTKLMFDV